MNEAMKFNHELDPLENYIDLHIGTTTTRHASEERFECPPLADAVSAERLMRSTIHEFFDDSATVEYKNIPTLSTIKSEYWDLSKNVTEKHGIKPDFDLEDYFNVDQDRYYDFIKNEVIKNSDPNSVTVSLFAATETYINELDIDSVLASKFTLNLFKRHLPLIQDRAQELIEAGNPEVSASSIAVKEFTARDVPTHVKFLEQKVNLNERKLHTIVNKTSTYPEVDTSGSRTGYIALDAKDAKEFKLISRIQERPYTNEELTYANELFKDPALQKATLIFHMAYVDYAVSYLAQHPERLQYSLEPFTEIFVVDETKGNYIPNPKLIRVIGNNVLPAVARVMLSEKLEMYDITPSIIQEGVILAKKLHVFQTQIGEFSKRASEQDDQSQIIDLKSVFTRTCPAMNMFTDALATDLPLIYEKCS